MTSVSSSSTLLATKLLIPVRRPTFVPRPRHINQPEREIDLISEVAEAVRAVCTQTLASN